MSNANERHERIVRALRSYTQADEEGIFVTVSRQACDEGADSIEGLKSELERITNDPLMAQLNNEQMANAKISAMLRSRDKEIEWMQEQIEEHLETIRKLRMDHSHACEVADKLRAQILELRTISP